MRTSKFTKIVSNTKKIFHMNTENVLINSNFEKRSTNKIHHADENKILHETCAMFIALLSYPQQQTSTSIHFCLPLPHFVSNSCCFLWISKDLLSCIATLQMVHVYWTSALLWTSAICSSSHALMRKCCLHWLHLCWPLTDALGEDILEMVLDSLVPLGLPPFL